MPPAAGLRWAEAGLGVANHRETGHLEPGHEEAVAAERATSPEAMGRSVLLVEGSWTIGHAAALNTDLHRLADNLGDPSSMGPSPTRRSPLELDCGNLQRLDTAGAWLLHQLTTQLHELGYESRYVSLRSEHRSLLDVVAERRATAEPTAPRAHGPLRVVERIGESTVEVLVKARDFLAFTGHLTETFFRSLLRPRRIRLTPTVFHMEEAGLNALPIVGLISFLIGVVVAYQGAVQLRQLGAEIFVVDLVAIGVLRELAVLLTAIVVAGRSGSAFTAELGTMQVSEEVDAIRTLGLEPLEVLVLPRVIALVVTLPLLVFFADLMGLLGGALMSWGVLDLEPRAFLTRLQEVAGVRNFWIGMVKAPVFALVVGMVGCFEGLLVRGSAEAVGQHTTRAVVESIFLVIVLDALFSIFFSVLGL